MKEDINKGIELTEAGNKNPFLIPDGYMDKFPDEVLKKIRKNELPVSVSPGAGISRLLRSQIALAAGFLAFALVIYTTVDFILQKEDTRISSNQTFSHIIEQASFQFDEPMLLEYIEDSDNLTGKGLDENYSDMIIDYLINENIELSMLLTEL